MLRKHPSRYPKGVLNRKDRRPFALHRVCIFLVLIVLRNIFFLIFAILKIIIEILYICIVQTLVVN